MNLGPLAVEVANKDHQDWRNVRVMLSDHFSCPTVDLLEESKSQSIRLATCTTSNGERFNPLTTRPNKVTVHAILANDTGEAIAAFTPTR